MTMAACEGGGTGDGGGRVTCEGKAVAVWAHRDSGAPRPVGRVWGVGDLRSMAARGGG